MPCSLSALQVNAHPAEYGILQVDFDGIRYVFTFRSPLPARSANIFLNMSSNPCTWKSASRKPQIPAWSAPLTKA
jgi:hypothetical protein